MTSKQELQKEQDRLNKEEKAKEREIEKSPEYVALVKEEKSLEKQKEKLEEKQEELEEEIRGKYTDDGKSPSYSKRDYYGNKNILPEVLNSIKRVLGIGSLSLLTGKQIEKITEGLIDKDLAELYQDKEYKETDKEIEDIGARLEKIEKETERLIKPAREIGDRTWELGQKIGRIEEEEKKLEKFKTKENFKQQEKKLKEKYKKQEQIRGIVENRNKLKEIIKPLQLEITKEKILNSLSDKDEED